MYLNNDSAFLPDGRGRNERTWLLNEEDLAARFDEHFGKLLASEQCSVQAMTDFVNGVGNDGLFQNEAKAAVLQQFGLSFPISTRTVNSWMLRRGGRYIGYSSGFYVDRHEDPDVIEQRHKYLDLHEKLLERRPMFIHLQDDEVDIIRLHLARKDDQQPKSPKTATADDGRTTSKLGAPRVRFQDLEGVWWNEYSVDDCELFDHRRVHMDLAGSCCKDYNADRERDKSCRFGHDPVTCLCHLVLLLYGQDESIFKPFQFSRMAWTKNGKRALRPKGDGQGIMVSAFQSDHDGIGLTLTDEQLRTVNELRAAAQPPRPPLTELPGVRLFEYGKSRQGYWDSQLMLQQVVDFMDCFEVLHPGHQLLLEMDKSGCHSKMADDAHISTHLSMGIAGKQRVPRPVKITQQSQLGPCPGRTVNMGDTFHFSFQEGDPPPLQHPEMGASEYVGKAKGECSMHTTAASCKTLTPCWQVPFRFSMNEAFAANASAATRPCS